MRQKEFALYIVIVIQIMKNSTIKIARESLEAAE